ncbi:MAG: class I SAM-dependent methyltransferase, partial [Rhodospirillales bacterium]|nr:class I SAM-dependent methyltransferase [Rhodospirillales bacterium]
ELNISPGQNLLDVGSGSGAIDRWLAGRTKGANQITGVDVNAYLIGEARDLVRRQGLDGIIRFEKASALELPFPDASFDRVFSSTVMEELDADRMLAELVRVTRPGGQVAVITRAVDMGRLVNLPVGTQLKARLEAPGGGGLDPLGCADASLYGRFARAGLEQVRKIPQIAAFGDAGGAYEQSVIGMLFGSLDATENAEARAALAKSREDGSFVVTAPFHGALGTKK